MNPDLVDLEKLAVHAELCIAVQTPETQERLRGMIAEGPIDVIDGTDGYVLLSIGGNIFGRAPLPAHRLARSAIELGPDVVVQDARINSELTRKVKAVEVLAPCGNLPAPDLEDAIDTQRDSLSGDLDDVDAFGEHSALVRSNRTEGRAREHSGRALVLTLDLGPRRVASFHDGRERHVDLPDDVFSHARDHGVDILLITLRGLEEFSNYSLFFGSQVTHLFCTRTWPAAS